MKKKYKFGAVDIGENVAEKRKICEINELDDPNNESTTFL